MEALLWAAGLPGARLRVACSNGDRRWDFENRKRRRLHRYQGNGSSGPPSVVIQWRCAGLDQRRVSRWLAIASRFAPARIFLDGTILPTGFVGGLFHLRLEKPVPCKLGLTRAGDEPVLWLLRDGVVSARASVPGYPSFEAAIELGGMVAPGASAADMRLAVQPLLNELVDRAVWMMAQVSARLPEMAAGERERLGILLLRAARKGIRTKEICELPLLEMASDDDLRLSVEGIRKLADQRGGVLSAIEASERAARDILDPQSTLLASSELRQLLANLAAVRFQSPSRRRRSFHRRVTARLSATAVELWHRIRGLVLRREVPLSDQRPHESDVLDAVRSVISPVELSLCEGQGSTGWTARGAVVPRTHPAIMVGAGLISVDSAWLYPLLLALDTGRDPPGDLRKRWLEAAESVALEK